ncbi:hypothetical protein FAZ95_39110 [Trinickia violacea]|uniref:Uncharacterized protein n=1 Tax=Trinickia violacea TaxID=2571746 RepID=A0A4P8J7K8_9BURK|nr:hypothetical protein [Trinickia violacea]QCP55139.1 hypothetical protein FAZ95_39110 [Trinickia violacea]
MAKTTVPMPDRGEFKMLEALVSEAVQGALVSGFCVEHFHGWEIVVTVSGAFEAARATMTIRHHGVLWQTASWALEAPLVSH